MGENSGLTRGKLFIANLYQYLLSPFIYFRLLFVSCSPSLLTKALAYFSASVYVFLEDKDWYRGASMPLSPSLFSPSQALVALPSLAGLGVGAQGDLECGLLKLTGPFKSFI